MPSSSSHVAWQSGGPFLPPRSRPVAGDPLLPPARRTSRVDIDPLLGCVIDGDFEVVRLIGTGSHADVYLARQRSVGQRTVAVKVLGRLFQQLSEGDRRRGVQTLQREGDLLGGLHAACFVDVYRAGMVQEGRPYIALEFAEGKTLVQVAREKPALDQVVDLLHQWAEGLAELHERGWVHRDVTPANAVVAETVFGTQRLMTYDLGTATQATGRPDRFRAGWERERPPGTAAYMSPEQAAGAVVDGRSDQFALAAIGFEALAGVRHIMVPTPGLPALLEYLRSGGEIPVESLHALRPDLPPAVGDVLHRALSREPERRFPDVRQFAEALVQAAHGAAADGRGRSAGTNGKSLFRRLFGGGGRS